MTPQNVPSTNPFDDLDGAQLFSLASFIGCQLAVVNTLDNDEASVKLGKAIVDAAQNNIETLMLGGSVKLGPHDVSIQSPIGIELAAFLGNSLEELAEKMDGQLQAQTTSEGDPNVTTN